MRYFLVFLKICFLCRLVLSLSGAIEIFLNILNWNKSFRSGKCQENLYNLGLKTPWEFNWGNVFVLFHKVGRVLRIWIQVHNGSGPIFRMKFDNLVRILRLKRKRMRKLKKMMFVLNELDFSLGAWMYFYIKKIYRIFSQINLDLSHGMVFSLDFFNFLNPIFNKKPISGDECYEFRSTAKVSTLLSWWRGT